MIYSNMQVCGEPTITIETYESDGKGARPTFITIIDGNDRIVMEPRHIRQLAAALDAHEAQAVQAAE